MTPFSPSPEQTAIGEWAQHSRRNGRCTARAGTGKTTTIERIVIPGVPEDKILYVVFNRKNKLEAESKIRDKRCEIKTFNGLGYAFVRTKLGRSIDTDDDCEARRVLAVAPGLPDGAVRDAVRLAAWCKNVAPRATSAEMVAIAADMGLDEDPSWSLSELADVTRRSMDATLEAARSSRLTTISFNDQVWLSVVLGWVRPWWSLVIVDEAQDMNLVQRLMVKSCVRRGGRVLFVGDDRQSIYGFRGAEQGAMDVARAEFRTEEMSLTTTYRCARAIVELARTEVPDYQAAAGAADGAVTAVANQDAVLATAAPGDAVLSRVNAPLMSLCLSLLKRGVRARIEGRDVGKMLASIAQSLRARTVPEFLTKVDRWQERKFTRIAARTALSEEKKQAQCEAVRDQSDVLRAVAEDASNVVQITNRLTSLFTDGGASADGSVVLSSVHKAKGLEWRRVFMLCETFRRNRGGEEANIWYVAVTRAKEELVLVGEERREVR